MSTATHGSYGTQEAARAAAAIRNRIGTHRPVAGLVLGSGLSGLADRFDDVRRVEYGETASSTRPVIAPTSR